MSERSGKYNFYKPSRDGNDIADINEITTNFTIIDENIPSNTDLTELGAKKQDKFADVLTNNSLNLVVEPKNDVIQVSTPEGATYYMSDASTFETVTAYQYNDGSIGGNGYLKLQKKVPVQNIAEPTNEDDAATKKTVETAKSELNESISSVNLTATTAVGLANSKGTWETIADTTVSETVSQYTITTDKNYKKLYIRIEMTEDTSEATEAGRIQLLIGSQAVWSDGSGWIGKTKSGSTTLKGTSNPKVIIFDIDVAENCTMIRARGAWNRTTIAGIDLYATHMNNPEGVGYGYDDWGTTSVVLNKGVTTNKIALYFRSTAYPLFAGSRVIVKGVQA